MTTEFTAAPVAITTTEFVLNSATLAREVTCTLYLPVVENLVEPLHLLLLNDGQDLPKMNYAGMLEELYEKNALAPVLTVGITAGERTTEYGLTIQADFKGRGAKAAAYHQFIVEELLPAISEQTGIVDFASKAIGGFSLGALSAFDLAWRHAGLFQKVGCFSGSFWWRAKDLDEGYTRADLLAHKTVAETPAKPSLRFWFQVGTKDETADRDQNGIIDSIDDTTSLIAELYKKGYQRDQDVTYLELLGGQHNVETWARVMPKFLVWAFGSPLKN